MIKNITFVTSYFAPAWAYGGPPRVLYILAKELIKQGKSVNVITTDVLDTRRNPLLREKMDGIEVYRFKTISNTLAYKMKIIVIPQVLKNVKKILDCSEVVLFSDLRSIINWQLYGYVAKRKIPYGIFAFGQVPPGSGFKSVVKKVFDFLWVGDFVKKASFRFCQTEHERKMFGKIFGVKKENTQLLLLPVDDIYHSDLVFGGGRIPSGSFAPLRMTLQKYNIKNSDKIILFVGRLHFLKGVDLLIEAVLPLIKKERKVKLVLVGRDDGIEKDLKKMIPQRYKKNVIFIGPLYGEKVAFFYKRADCYTFSPRFFEETSLAALEALSFGVSVVTTKESEIPFLDEYTAGITVENNRRALQKAIKKILYQSKALRDKTRLQAVKLIREKYSVSLVARKLIFYLDELKKIVQWFKPLD